MLQSEVIRKLAIEECIELGDFDYFAIAKKYLAMALDVGINHFRADMEEIIVLDINGTECGRYKSVSDASRRTGVATTHIYAVLCGRSHTAGGFMFVRARDFVLTERTDDDEKLKIIPLK